LSFDFFAAIFQWLTGNYLEFIAVIAGITGVYLTARLIVWCWPIAVINVVLSTIIFYNEKLYQDAILQVFYLLMAFYGWYNWLHGGTNKTELAVSRMKLKYILFFLFSGGLFIYLFGFVFSTYTDAALPYWDATTTVWGIIGTFLMASKKIENWIIWIIIDLLCTGIYFYKELYGFTALYFIYSILAIYGFIAWYKEFKLTKV